MLFFKLFLNIIGLIYYQNFTKMYNKTININNEIIFNENIKFINDMNSKNLTYTLDINEYTDIKLVKKKNDTYFVKSYRLNQFNKSVRHRSQDHSEYVFKRSTSSAEGR